MNLIRNGTGEAYQRDDDEVVAAYQDSPFYVPLARGPAMVRAVMAFVHADVAEGGLGSAPGADPVPGLSTYHGVFFRILKGYEDEPASGERGGAT